MNNMLNDLKRTILSIKEHKLDSIIIFFIVLILTTLMMVYWTFYKVSDDFSTSIKNNTKVNIILTHKTSSYADDKQLSELFANNKDAFNTYKNQLAYFVQFINSLNDDTKNITSHSLLHCEFKSDIQNKTNISDIDIYSSDETLFNDEDFIITKGRYLYDNDINKIIVNENSYKQINDETITSLDVGDIISLTGNDKESFEYEIVGLYTNNSTKTIIDNNSLYDKNVSAILLTKDIIKMLSPNDKPYLTKGIVTLISEEYSKDLINDINSSYKSIVIDKDGIKLEMSYSLDYDNSLITKLNKPIKSLSKLFQIASIITVLIMLLLLFNFLNLLVHKRKRDIAIFIALGQTKIKTILNFFLEIVLITTFAFVISIPIGYKITTSITENMIVSNINKQELIADITGNTSIDELEITRQAYKDYSLNIDIITCALVYLTSIVIVFISSIYSLIKISLISPKELLNK